MAATVAGTEEASDGFGGKRKAIRGTLLAALVAAPLVITANMKLSPETIRSFQQTARAEQQPTENAKASSDDDDNEETEAEKIADGSHCINGWSLTFPPLEDAVKEQLRNPRSFEQISTSWSHMGKDGKFGLVMKYRAQNGFGGMNVEAVGALVDARTCRFHQVDVLTLMKRTGADPSTS